MSVASRSWLEGPASRGDSSGPISEVRPLIIRFGAMGDMILLTGLMRALHRRFGSPCDVLSSGGWTEPLLRGNPDLGELRLIKSRKTPYPLSPEQWHLVSWLRQRPRGPIYICDAYAQDKIRWLLGRAGVSPADCVFYSGSMFAEVSHWFDVWKKFAGMSPENYSAYPGNPESYPRIPQLSVAADAQHAAQGFLDEHRIAAPVVLVQPGNKRTLKRGRLGALGDDKAWPTANWIELCGKLLLLRPDAHIVLCGVPSEQPLLSDIAAGSNSERVHALGEDLPIPRLLALMLRADSMISIDSGPAHAAAALGCPTVVLYGRNRPENWLPRGSPATPVAGLEAPPGRPRAVEEISVDRVVRAWRSLSQHLPLTSDIPDGATDHAYAGRFNIPGARPSRTNAVPFVPLKNKS